MAKFDFSVLYDQYPVVISQMTPIFDSHLFILELARQNQAEYVRALHSYLVSEGDEAPVPFQVVHGILAKKLKDFPDLVVIVRINKPSTDIFGNSSECAEWRKLN